MSDDVLRIIPTDCNFIPSNEAQSKAISQLEKLLPEGEMCEAQVYDEVTFIDCGENFEKIICPVCGKETEFDPFKENDPGVDWWYESTDKLEGTNAQELQTTMPCCKASVPFTSVKFYWPAGFSRFELSIYNPDISRNLTEAELSQLEGILGCKLTQVRAHY